ncbi:unnamed protein product (macronuclear) [Paramecium tetraurelia]|uniref:RRM domain-containing protein n=1 Tax=Paramecium tetraurelia TaxID=5888 RepID=A0E577_PARTE|nr:uncharacterized protein GSPATT00023621001 [Paramecium tetraurelia]CAK90444.1 unnamed protein product [Paramecium tetraurelia]|eukprot:XP_001457841.1 hypothetical protein (macronuclear) [Paramecium tetraurelia strain d4-2]
MYYQAPTPMMPLAHAMNNPLQVQQAANIRKPDFPPDMQPIFVIPQIAHIKSQLKPKCRAYDPILGVGRKAEWMLDKFEDEYEQMEREEREKGVVKPSRLPLKILKKQEMRRQHSEEVRKRLQTWNPFEDANITSDPYKTLFVGRLNFATTDKKLRKEFEEYGPIKSVRIVRDSTHDKPRGYAFIEYESKNSVKSAYKYAVDKRVDGRKVVVDIERGRTILKWRPRYLGGGLGELRRSRSEELLKKTKDDQVEKEEEDKRRKTKKDDGKSSKKPRSRSKSAKKHKKRDESEFKKNKKREKSKKKHK